MITELNGIKQNGINKVECARPREEGEVLALERFAERTREFLARRLSRALSITPPQVETSSSIY